MSDSEIKELDIKDDTTSKAIHEEKGYRRNGLDADLEHHRKLFCDSTF